MQQEDTNPVQHNSRPNGGRVRTRPAPLTGSTVIIGLVSLFADISTEMMYPLLPSFITEVLHAPVVALGIIEGVAQGASSVLAGLSGWISDRLGKRKPVAFAGYALTAVSKPFIGMAGSWMVVLAARFSDRFGKGIRSAPRDALLAESAPAGERGRAFGFERAMDSTGAVLGPILAIALIQLARLNDRTVFYLATIPASIAAILILAVREAPGAVQSGGSSLRLTLAGTPPQYRRLLVIIGVFGLANSANAFLILRAGQLGLATGWTILAYALYNAVSALASMPAGSASDRFGRRNLLIIGYSLYAISYIGFGAARSAWLVWPLFALYGLFPALTDGVAKALAVDTAGKTGRGTAVGLYSTVVGITQIAASYVGGELWDRMGPASTFFFGAALALLAVVLLFLLLPARQNASTVTA
ncbi:MAG TPA: MFS transporter [Blastocatellia bacterium]|nr:MFS transporter [Blastocatellia bacterium]